MDYLLTSLFFVCIHLVLALTLDLVVGHSGLISIAHGGIFGIGAYVFAIATSIYDQSFCSGVLFAVAAGLVAAGVLFVASLRMRGEFFILGTFGLQAIVVQLASNLDLTGKAAGLSGIAAPLLFGWSPQTPSDFFLLALALAGISTLISWILTRGHFGRVLHALREDDLIVRSAGRSPAIARGIVFTVSSGIAALAGCLYAPSISFIEPKDFDVLFSLLILSMVILGGASSKRGALAGALIVTITPEVLRLSGLSTVDAANVQHILYGSLLVAAMIFRPRGIFGQFSFPADMADQ